jgi:outer membrane protein OmpA-like peptidoglycan-associated protein
MGCPDKDMDGIADHLDSCPNIQGLAIFKGCPDTDEDGVEDRFDFCPLDFGLSIHFGCPDSDKDGLLDYQDSCKFMAGPIENKGCPYNDTDGDGIIDKKDKCPFEFGIAANNGCPDNDWDKDGILNMLDSCPNTFGVAQNFGCPIVEEAEKEIIEFAFKNLEFETNQSIILTESFESLDKLAQLLQKKKDWKLLLSGHTDDVGNAQDNLILSKNRAKSVQEYLVEKGVEMYRIKTE